WRRFGRGGGPCGAAVTRHRGGPAAPPAGSHLGCRRRGRPGRLRMSWQVASFIVLGFVLLGGFAWYERSKPPSQVVAVVAALAALAVAGRIAFAAVPNVVATTDIVIFAGFVFGAAPGFAVAHSAASSPTSGSARAR